MTPVDEMNPTHTRDGGRCVMHGDRAQTVHHRNHVHTDNRPSNLLSVCGSGTTRAHGFAESWRDIGEALGWNVTKLGTGPGADPAEVPVWMANGPYGKGWYGLDDDGTFWGWPGSVADPRPARRERELGRVAPTVPPLGVQLWVRGVTDGHDDADPAGGPGR